MKKEKIKEQNSVLQKVLGSGWFTILLLCFLAFTEWYTLKYGHFVDYKCVSYAESKYPYIIILLWVILLFIVATGLSAKVYIVSKYTVKKFLTNALGLKWISFLFILFFLVHISWISDVLYKLIVNSEGNYCQVVVLFVGLLILCLIFPQSRNRRQQVPDDDKTLLITGVSGHPFTERSLDLLSKPFMNEAGQGYRNIQNVVIFLSDLIFNGDIKFIQNKYEQRKQTDNIQVDKKQYIKEQLPLEIGEKITKVYAKIDPTYLEQELQDVNTMTTLVVESIVRHDQKKLKYLLGAVVMAYIKSQYLCYADREINIFFSDNVYDYNDFEVCYTALGELIRKYEKKLNRSTAGTLIHISPGTNILSSVISLYAIKASRTLLYTDQETGYIKALDYDLSTTYSVFLDLLEEHEDA